jgi:cobalt-zinc-cadmium efflux system protein
MPAASAHALVAQGQDCHVVRENLEHVLENDYKITHTTLQVDHIPGPLMAGHGDSGRAGGPHCDDSHGPVHRPAAREPSGD